MLTKPPPPLDRISRIQVETNLGQPLGTIDDPERVQSIVAFVNARKDQWENPWYGVPVGPVRVSFYQNTAFVGSFSAGNGFFATHRQGDFASQLASTQELEEFTRLIGVSADRLRR